MNKLNPPLKVTSSGGLASWLESNNVALAITSYQSGTMFLMGSRGGKITLNCVNYGYAMGITVASPTELFVATSSMIWRLVDVGPDKNVDRRYVFRQSHAVNGLDVHEIVTATDKKLLFTNTAYSCVSSLDNTHSFKIEWLPSFITDVCPEDRCHLNGLALRDSELRYVTVMCKSNIVAGWRDRRETSGGVIDVNTGEFVISDLSMPHSPRYHDNALWVLDSGRGYLLREREKIAFLPGFLRGLAFHANFAIVGISLPRHEAFAGLDLENELKSRDAEPWCGVQIVDLKTGHIAEWFRFTSGVRELFDVAVIPDTRLPTAISPSAPEFLTTRTIAQ
jgi:uncharacterized protein (TIGR03032 family)